MPNVLPRYLSTFYLLTDLIPPAVGGEVCMEQRRQPTPLTQICQEMTARNPPKNNQTVTQNFRRTEDVVPECAVCFAQLHKNIITNLCV